MAPIRVILLGLVLASGSSAADDERARINYLIHCQGCHLPQAVGVPGNVPRMKDFVGYFMHSTEGREFVVEVPGVSTANLNDEQLTELVNWLLLTYSAGQLPADFVPYSTDEVAELRRRPEQDPEMRRAEILERLAADLPALRTELENNDG